MNINEDLQELKVKLKELAEIINSFKSEAVQLRIVELLFESRESDLSGHPPETPEKRKSKPKTKLKKTEKKVAEAQKKKRETGARRGGKGAFAAVSKLVEEGFFASPKTIRDIINHCGTSLGLHFKPNEISPPLLRLLRDNRLTREKNKDNQYEYKETK